MTFRAQAEWDRIAAGYDRCVTPSHLDLAGEGLRRAGVRAGMRFLDVAAGSGALSIPAARLGADVLATDLSAAMLECLAARARSEGLRIETRVMDGESLELDDEVVDVAGSQFGVMLFPDMPKGIREMARVTRARGRVLVTAYADPRRIDFLTFLVEALRSVRPDFEGLPTDPPPLPLQLQDPERLRAELAGAGLVDVDVAGVTEIMELETGRELWDWLVSSNPIVETVLGSLALTEEEREAVREALEGLVRDRAGADGVARLESAINIGVGTK